MANIVNYVAKTNWATNETVKPTDYNKVEQGIKDNNDGLKALNTEVGGLPTLVANKVDKVDIVDNLTTSDASKVLSAKQGKLLNDNKVNISSIVNNLTSTSTNVPLSANQGRLLDVNKVSISSIVDNLNSNVSTVPLSAKQGKLLNDNKVDISSIVNNLNSTATNAPLSANQGKVLNDNINTLIKDTSVPGKFYFSKAGKSVTLLIGAYTTKNDIENFSLPSGFQPARGQYIPAVFYEKSTGFEVYVISVNYAGVDIDKIVLNSSGGYTVVNENWSLPVSISFGYSL